MVDSPIVLRLLALAADNKLESGEDLLALSEVSSHDMEDIELGRLNWSPRENWIDQNGGLPRYIEDIAIAIMRSTGYPRERAIPIAINRVKRWAKGLDGVNADTQAKAIKALAEWEAMKAKAKAKRLAKKAK